MRRCRVRRGPDRLSRLETLEPRVLLSADPAAELALDYLIDGPIVGEPLPMLADAHAVTGLEQIRAEYGFTGAGQTVVVVDSGIAYDHLALGGGFGPGYQVVGGFDFTEPGDADPYDDGPCGSHGTHVAGIIASNDGLYPGVAPGVDLVALRVFDDAGCGSFGWVEDALQWVHEHRQAFPNPITTVNLSLGTNSNSERLPDWANLEEEFAQLEADGMFITVAAGNRFLSYQEPGLCYPAVSPHVVPVGAVDLDGTLSYFSQRHPRMIAAPGRTVLSTVPDYVGNRDGIHDDFAGYSGTSMAAPYVAASSVLLRQGCRFAGRSQVTQQTLYNLMRNTADTVYDAQTGLDYRRLNLQRALDAVMPEDDFGSNRAMAEDLGTIAEAYSIRGTIGRLSDHDWFSLTAGATGTLTVQLRPDGELMPRWHAPAEAPRPAIVNGNRLTFEVLAGETYAFGLGTEAGLGHYSLELDLAAAGRRVDWGTLSQGRFRGCPIDASGAWYDLAASADGILTIEAFCSHLQGHVDLKLYDAKLRLVGANSGPAGVRRIDVTASAGERFHLWACGYGGAANQRADFRVTNLVSRRGDGLFVSGTAGDDAFRCWADRFRLAINGVEYPFDAASVGFVTFDGRGGKDTAILTGSTADDSAVLRLGRSELRGPGYRLLAVGAESVTIEGGGGTDAAVFYDSAGNDTFVGARAYGGMFGPGFTYQAKGFRSVQAWATEGGFDVTRLYDSPDDDLFVATPTYGALFGPALHHETRFFEGVHAYATAGGTDVARLYDSPGDDRFFATPTFGALYGEGFLSRAKFFEGVHAYATAGGTDVADLYDSPFDDVFVSLPDQAALYGAAFYNRAKFFKHVRPHHEAGGNDRARVCEAPGMSRAQVLTAAIAQLRAAAGWVYGFEYDRATATKGRSNKGEVATVDYLLQLEPDWR